MIHLIGGDLWQWDTGRNIKITRGTPITEVHYVNHSYQEPLILAPYEQDGMIVCDIPEELLHTAEDIDVYLVSSNEHGIRTIFKKVLCVNARPQPSDFKYTSLQNIIKGLIDRTIENVVVPEGIAEIGSAAFQDCRELKTIQLPSSITAIGSSAFYLCMDLEKIIMSDNITEIGNSAFSNCYQLEGGDFLPSKLTIIENNAFLSCRFENVIIPASVEIIKKNAFGNNDLIEVTFEGTPNSIDSQAFASCNELVTINVPWAKGEVANVPWGATNATINYNYSPQ